MAWRLTSRAALGKGAAFCALTGDEQRIMALTAVLMPATVLAVSRLGYQRTRRLFEGLEPGALAGSSTTAADVAATVDTIAMRMAPHRTCLARALVLWHVLRRRGIESEVCFGVESRDRGIAAHAWVEVDGQPIGGGPETYQRFRPASMP